MSLSNPASVSGPSKCYRPGRKFLSFALSHATLFLLVGTASVFMAYSEADRVLDQALPGMLFFGIFWSCPLSASLWMLLSYFRFRVIITKQAVQKQGCVFQKTIEFDDVVEAVWKKNPRGRGIIIRDPNTKMKIVFDSFAPDDEEDLIESLRQRIDKGLQREWPTFLKPFPITVPRSHHSAWFALLCVFCFFAAAVGPIYCWWHDMGARFILFAVLIALPGIWYLWRMSVYLHRVRTCKAKNSDNHSNADVSN